MKIKNEKEALQMFCSKDEEIREYFLHPFVSEKDGGLIYATDGMVLLKVDSKLVRGKYPKCNRHLPDDWKKENLDIIINFDKIDEARKGIIMVEEEVEEVSGEYGTCPDCGGFGRVDYEFKSYTGEVHFLSDTCPTCNGAGSIGTKKTVKTGNMIIPKDALFEMGGAYFAASNVLRAVDALRLMGYDKMKWICRDKDYRDVFYVDKGIRLYLMECYVSKAESVEDKDVTRIEL